MEKSVMVLTVVELIFFINAHAMLCFGFLIKILIITHQYFLFVAA